MMHASMTVVHDFVLRCYRSGYSSLEKHHLHLLRLPRTPYYVQLELTNACNMTCPHCSRQRFADKRPVGYIDLGLFKAIVDEISNSSSCFLRIGGLGEPALHPNLAAMLDYLRQRSIRTELITNGTFLMKLTPQQIIDSGIEVLGISIDGHDSASYARHRPGGNYDIIRHKVIDLFSAKKASHNRFPEIQIRSIIFPDTSLDNIRTFRQNWLPFADFVRFNTFTSGEESEVEAPVCCTEIDFVIHVRWDGRVPLCGYQHWHADTEWLGNVRKLGIKVLWRSQRLEELRRAHKNLDLRGFEFCKRCAHVQQERRTLDNVIKWNKHRNPAICVSRTLMKMGRRLI